MYRHSPARSQRSKGIKVRHVLQIILLVGVCFWLIYQVKHSHDKKKELDAHNSFKTQSGDVTIKFGRKDIHPREQETGIKVDKREGGEEEEDEETAGEDNRKDEEEDMKFEKHEREEAEEEETGGEEDSKQEEDMKVEKHDGEDTEEEEETDGEEENRHEEEMKFGKHAGEETEEEETGGEEQNKHEDVEREEEDNAEEKDDEGRGDGDDEQDERDQERSRLEVGHEEDSLDEKEREGGDEHENENSEEEKDSQTEEQSSLEDHDHDGGVGNAREAREEQYKADDASSAVTHDTQSISTENSNLENSNENNGMNVLESENKVVNMEEINDGQNTSLLTVGDNESAENGTSLSATTSEEKVNEGMSSETLPLKLTTLEFNNQTEVSINSSEASIENNGSSLPIEVLSDSTEAEHAKASDTTSGEGTHLQTITLEPANNSNLASNDNQANSTSTISTISESTVPFTKPESVFLEMSTSTNSSVETNSSGSSENVFTLEMSTRENASAITTSSESSERVEDTTTAENGQSDTRKEIDGENDRRESFKTENVDEVQHDPIDSSIHLEEKEVRTDLDTLPQIQIEGGATEDTAAE